MIKPRFCIGFGVPCVAVLLASLAACGGGEGVGGSSSSGSGGSASSSSGSGGSASSSSGSGSSVCVLGESKIGNCTLAP